MDEDEEEVNTTFKNKFWIAITFICSLISFSVSIAFIVVSFFLYCYYSIQFNSTY